MSAIRTINNNKAAAATVTITNGIKMNKSSKFTSTSCIAASKPRQYRADIGPLSAQLEATAAVTKDLKKTHHRQEQALMSMTKADHCTMLLQLLAEANTFHAKKTNLFVCKITSQVVTPNQQNGLSAGLSSATMKALVTDVDIVMNDDDKDNYQHALSAIAALSLWH